VELKVLDFSGKGRKKLEMETGEKKRKMILDETMGCRPVDRKI
jgi:hypothetical protein